MQWPKYWRNFKIAMKFSFTSSWGITATMVESKLTLKYLWVFSKYKWNSRFFNQFRNIDSITLRFSGCALLTRIKLMKSSCSKMFNRISKGRSKKFIGKSVSISLASVGKICENNPKTWKSKYFFKQKFMGKFGAIWSKTNRKINRFLNRKKKK